MFTSYWCGAACVLEVSPRESGEKPPQVGDLVELEDVTTHTIHRWRVVEVVRHFKVTPTQHSRSRFHLYGGKPSMEVAFIALEAETEGSQSRTSPRGEAPGP